MPRYTVTVALLVLLVGCTHTRVFDPGSSEKRAEVNARAERGLSVLQLRSDERIQARSVHVAPDVTTWIDPATGTTESISTSELEAIRFKSRGRGVLEGLGLGLAIGAGVGAVLGAVSGATDEGGLIDLTPAEGALVGSVAFGGVGVGVGGLAGLERGSRTVYIVPAPARDR